jgi:hypothetical protein
MTILAAFDPQTLDRAPVRFAVAAAKFADVPLVLASVRASVAPAPSAQEDVIGEELERLRADIITTMASRCARAPSRRCRLWA